MSLTVQGILDAATSANAATLGTGEASKIFRSALENSIKVRVNLKPDDRNYLSRAVSFPIVFTNEKTVTNDHALLCAMREIGRDVFERNHHIQHARERTLIIGAAEREIRKYQSNPNIHYYLHMRENKDYDRVIRPAYTAIVNTLKAKAQKSDYRIFLEPQNKLDTGKMRGVVKRYFEAQQMLNDYCTLMKMPANVHTSLVNATTLVFEDSIYNYDQHSLTKLFVDTGAHIAFGYALLPMELLFPDMAENRIYRFEQQGQMSVLTFRQGHSNGYAHLTKNWETLLKRPAMSCNGISLAVEITSRIGPMAVFKIYRCENAEIVVRTIELQPHEEFVRVLDTWASVDHVSCKFKPKLQYFSVKESEYWETLNYMLSLDPKSLTLQNCMTYVRRRMGGMSLVSKELVSPWDLPKADAYKFAIAVTMQAMLMHEKTDKTFMTANVTSLTERLKAWIRQIAYYTFYPISLLLEWLFSEHLTDRIILFPCGYRDQRARIVPTTSKPLPIDVTIAFPNEEGRPVCPFCDDIHDNLGDQKLDCKYKAVSNHTFKLSEDQLAALRNKLMDDDNDMQGIRDVKAAAKEKLPGAAFEHTCRVSYIRGGPGCGKSHIIRAISDQSDLICAPFMKLKPDYERVKSETGDTFDLPFKTQHRAMTTTGYKRIFVDEFTSFPYEMLCVTAFNNKCEEIILVGDERQTKTQEPDEGMYTGRHIKLDELSTHELLVNFRNPKDTVALLNQRYGYNMRAHSQIEDSIKVINIEEIPNVPCIKMAFTAASAKFYTESEKNTVRANQGGTTDVSVLYATKMDGNLPMIDELGIVGISRHKEKLFIVTDNSDESKNFLSKLDISEDFKQHIQEYVSIPIEEARAITVEDPDVAKVLGELEHAPKDVHLVADTMTPVIAYHPDITSLNHVPSHQVDDVARSTQINVDDMFAQVNMRGHLVKSETKYYSASAGFGKHYTQKNHIQELAVAVSRYDNKTRPKSAFDDEARKYADLLLDQYFEEHKTKCTGNMWYESNAFDDMHINDTAREFMRAAMSKSYDKQYKGFLDNPDINVVRFHLKNIFKPETTTKEMDLGKVGQGISAWNTDLLSRYCLAFRLLSIHDRMTDRKDPQYGKFTVTDNGISEVDFLKQLKAYFDNVGQIPGKPFGISDAKEFDSCQNEWTQYIERGYWKRLGVSEQFLEEYYTFRSGFKLYFSTGRLSAKSEKTSGEPGTLVNNGIVSKVLSNAILRGLGPCIMTYKGDDFMKYQSQMKVDKDAQMAIEEYCPLRFTLHIREYGEFCGMTISSAGMLPNIKRRFDKMMGQRFKDYEHFCEYQKSLRDYLALVKEVGVNSAIGNTMLNSGCTEEEATYLLHIIDSWSHLDERQFKDLMTYNVEEVLRPVRDQDSEDHTMIGIEM